MNEVARFPLTRAIRVLTVCLLAFALAPPAVEAAQDSQPPPATPDPIDQAARARALKQWVDDYTRWRQALDQAETNGRPRPVRPRPEPPEWLFADCRNIAVGDPALWVEACRLLTGWNDDATTAEIRREIANARAQKEKLTKSIWWQRVHMDVLWPMTQSGSGVYGIVGTHVTMEVAGRFQIFVAPGAMLLNVPGERGGREWKVATDWGVAYRLVDFTFPGTRRHAQMHMNLATAWVFSGPESLLSNRINLAGLSFTFKQPAPP